jgi:hypothetical protein
MGRALFYEVESKRVAHEGRQFVEPSRTTPIIRARPSLHCIRDPAHDGPVGVGTCGLNASAWIGYTRTSWRLLAATVGSGA